MAESKQCAQRCITVLDNSHTVKDPDIKTPQGKAESLTNAFHERVTLLLPAATATAALASTRAMLAGQLPERIFLESNAPFPDIYAYLKLREQPFGLLPQLLMLEHYFTPGGVHHRCRPGIELLMKQVIYTAILQNDAGGLEKDIKNANPSNTILILAQMAGQPIQKAKDVLGSQESLSQAEALHDSLVQQVITTYLRIQNQATSEGERLFSRMMLDLCRRQLQWTVGTPRYDVSLQ